MLRGHRPGRFSHDLFDHQLVALRALRDPLPTVRGPVAGRPGRLRGLHERLRPGRIEGEGLQPDEVVQLVHDLRREDRLELGEELGLRRPEVPPAGDEQQDALAEQATGAARPSLRQDGVDGQGDDRRERVFDALAGPRARQEHRRGGELLPEPGGLLRPDRHRVRPVDLVERDAHRHRTGDLRHDLHPVLDQMEGVRPLDVAHRQDALGAEEERLGEDLADGMLAHQVEEGDVGEGDILAFQADLKVRPLKPIHDERGYLMEMLRSDWPEFTRFGQVYVTIGYPNIVKGWHFHKVQTDNFIVVRGQAKVVCYDNRDGSKTKGKVNEFFPGERNPMLIQIPPFVVHGFKAVGGESVTLVNVPTELYKYDKPDEFRIPYNSKDIPYNWDVEMK